MSIKDKDQHWLDLITKCRTSGLTDRQWCLDNKIPASTFYYHVRTLRKKACALPEAVPSLGNQSQEIVPLNFVKESLSSEQEQSTAAIRIFFHDIQLEIMNDADADIIKNTLLALQRLC